MSNSKFRLSFSFSIFFSFICFASSSSFNTTKKCSPQQTLALLLFKQNLSSINFTADDPESDFQCSYQYDPLMMNWNKSTDCCKWDGVTCNRLTGDVIGINLKCGMIQGTIHPNTTLFHLPKLESLDLSWNGGLKIQPNVLVNLLQNSTHLRELVLSGVDIGWVLPTYLNISSSLKSLSLKSTGLKGKLPRNMFSLPYLEQVDLSVNEYLTGPWPTVNKSLNIPIKSLDLSSTNLSGETFGSIEHLTSLKYLALSDCGLYGSFPKSLLNITHLTTLKLIGNMLSGNLPSLLFTLPLIKNILLGSNLFSGGLPLELFNCRSLQYLSLRENQLDGEINQGSTPSLFSQLINLTALDFSSNNFKSVWNFETLLSSLPNLQLLDLSNSGLSVVTNNSTSYVNPDFWYLDLGFCNLNAFPESLRAMKNLHYLSLNNNEIRDRIPDWASEIGGSELLVLNLSNNSITGLPQFQWDGLFQLYLQSNMIQGPFPPSICNMSNLQFLDMANNSFNGVIPQCLGNISSLRVIHLGTNLFHGTIPNTWEDYGQLQWLILNENQFEGEVPTSLSKCRDLKILDLGNNYLNGTFPVFLEDLPGLQILVLKSNNLHGPIETSSTFKLPFPLLQVLDLSHNRFVGHLPDKYFQNFNAMKDLVRTGSKPTYFQQLSVYYSVIFEVKGRQLPFPQFSVDYTVIDLSNNSFEGEIPDVIGTLNSLIVLNLSHNNLNGQIPHALGSLSQIESLDLSWNQLTGEIPQSLADITDLEVLNLSQNHLVGRIPKGTQFNTFEGNSFEGNLGLCGFPLPKQCENPSSTQLGDDGDEEESGFTWKVVMLGYGCGTLPGLLIGYFMLSTGRPKRLNAFMVEAEHMIQTRKIKRRRFIFIGR